MLHKNLGYWRSSLITKVIQISKEMGTACEGEVHARQDKDQADEALVRLHEVKRETNHATEFAKLWLPMCVKKLV